MRSYTCLPDELTNSHQGESVIIIANGPSTGDFDLTDSFFTENITFGCNRLGEIFKPTYYCLIAGETLSRYQHLVPSSSVFFYSQVMSRHPSFQHNLLTKRGIKVRGKMSNRVGLPTIGKMYHGGNSGTWMMHVAYQMGFARFFLLGLDGWSRGGRLHFYGNESVPESIDYTKREKMVEEHLNLFVQGLEREGKGVWNLSQRSVYESAPKCTLEQAKDVVKYPWNSKEKIKC